MSIWNSLAGMQVLRLISADPEGALAALQKTGITLLDMKMIDPLTWEFTVHRSDVKIIENTTNRRGDTLTHIRSIGIFWTLLRLRKRPVLLLGMLCLLVLSCYVPSRVFFVQVEGNVTVPSRYIAQQAQSCGIFFGASRKTVRSEQVKNQLLSQMPQLQWAGVNTAGCVAVITVQERNTEEMTEEKSKVSSIVAVRDGIIAEMTVLRGNGLCNPGQAVKAGQVLISGYTNCGLCIQATQAEGEIMAYTQRRLSAVYPENRVFRGRITGTEEKISLIIGKKQINFSKCSGISGGSCAKIYEQKYMTLPGGFVLPVSVIRERITYYETSVGAEDDGEQCLRDFARNYVCRQTIAGKIENAQVFVSASDGLFRLEGIYGCLENIGVVRVEESLPNYGKSD